MVPDPTTPRIDPRTLADALDYRDAMNDSRNMAAEMLKTFKGVSDILSRTTRMTGDSAVNFTKMAEMSKEVLSNAKIRGQIDQQIYSDNESAEERITQLQFKKIKYQENFADISKQTSDAEAKREREKSNLFLVNKKSREDSNRAERNILNAQFLLANAVSERQKKIANEKLRSAMDELSNAATSRSAAVKSYKEAELEYKKKKQERDSGIQYYNDEIKKEKEKIKQNEKASIEIKRQQGFMSHLKDSSYEALGGLGKMIKSAEDFADVLKKSFVPFVILEKLLELGFIRFEKLDKAAEDFRKQTGFSNTQMVELRKNAESINVEFQDMGVGITEVYASAKALTDVFGRTSLVSRDAMQNVSLMSVNLGVAAEDSANVLATFQGLGGATQEVAMNVMKVGAGFSEKAGIPFSLVMKDIANASEQTTAMLGANPSKLMKSAIAARALGTDLNKIVSSQRKLLDFSSSINEELEASALLGRSISFQKARQLAYDGDIEGAAKATLDSVKAAGDFNAMNVYQREALAKASGMELKDLTKMMAVEAQRQEIELRGTPEQKAKLKMQTEALAKLKEENDLSKEGLLAEGDRAIRQQKMQGQMTKLKNIMESIAVSLGDILEPIITGLSNVVVPLFKFTALLVQGMSILIKILVPISAIYAVVDKMSGSALRFSEITRNIAAWFLKGARYVETFADGLSGIFKVFKPFASIIGSVLKGFASFAKFLGPIGWIVTAIQFVVSLWTRFSNLFSSDKFVKADWPTKFVLGLEAIGGALYDVLLQPFVDVYQWIKKRLMGNSPSEIGLGIVDGIKAVGGMLLDVIISPFKAGFEFVTSAFSYVVNSIKNVASDIFGFITSPFKKAMEFVKSIPLFGKLFGGNDIGTAAKPQVDNSTIENSSIIEVKNLDALRDVVQELTNAVANLATAAPAAAGATATMNTSGIEAKLDTLTNLLTGGAVRVYLDGKDVSSAMSGIGR